MKNLRLWIAKTVCCLGVLTVQAQQTARQYPGTIILVVDATDAPRKIFHIRMTIPVAPGPLTLLFPKWIPGEHGPTGPINGLTGLKMTARP